MARIHGVDDFLEVFGVVHALDREALTFGQVVEAGGILDTEPLVQLLVPTGAQLVEDVEVALLLDLTNDARLLEQKVGDLASVWLARSGELDLHVFAEATRVIVSERLSVAEGFQQRVRLKYDVFDVLDLARVVAARHFRYVAHDVFGADRFAWKKVTFGDKFYRKE